MINSRNGIFELTWSRIRKDRFISVSHSQATAEADEMGGRILPLPYHAKRYQPNHHFEQSVLQIQ